jgi:hypothetical protein
LPGAGKAGIGLEVLMDNCFASPRGAIDAGQVILEGKKPRQPPWSQKDGKLKSPSPKSPALACHSDSDFPYPVD